MKRKILEYIIEFVSFFWRLIPWKVRNYLFLIPFVLEGRGKHTKAFERLFKIEDDIKWVYNELALRYGNGVHIKHNLMKYANFFKKNIGKSQTVLDIGCGYGAVAFSIAESINMVKVIGVDIDANKIKEAKKKFKRNNLTFINNDAFSIDIVDVDVIILSNVLEHIEDRVGFLMRLKKQFNPSLYLIRVPDLERDWSIPFKKEMGIYYFSDKTHFIEHTEEEFRKEIKKAGLKTKSLTKNWSEIWAECES